MRLSELASQEGAESLISTVELGGARARVALQALPFAVDVSAVEQRICGLLPRVVLPERPLVLSTIVLVSEPPERLGEPLGAAEPKVCLSELTHLVAEGKPTAEERDLASAALHYYKQLN